MALIGAHVSAAGGVAQAPLNAYKEGCEVFQFFLHPPQSYQMGELTSGEIINFKNNCLKYHFQHWFIHAGYLINLASIKNRVRYGSINLLKKSLKRASLLNADGLMFHLGSASGQTSREKAIKVAISSLNKILTGYNGSTPLLIENSAGAGNTLGKTFSEIGTIIKGVKNKRHLGLCVDLQHAFASGYDWRSREGINAAVGEIKKQIGLQRLKVLHANDSQAPCGSNRDRHEHIGDGYIGKDGFQLFLQHNFLKKLPFIVETAGDRTKDISILKKLQ